MAEAEAWWEATPVSPTVYAHLAAIRAFVDGRLTAREFEVIYLNIFKYDPHPHEDSVAMPLERLFAEVDAFVADPALRAEVGGSDEETLRQVARETLAGF
ncbi:colicin immunity domain-containing protein [Micromonospora endolithica]|uniref:colicin immunity domain-containing protein n=1 Tax=Micromonospora endolithica TaxID=230091 RepID=UPI0011ABBBF7|nr:colicin immunity domain-containing protein [Micromonospora endolithica]TWJ24392.1 self-protective colicin-like immunity protein [Micromonospora endolithica]